MGRVAVLSGRDVCAILKANGFVEKAQKGSHVVMRRDAPPARTVPVPNHDPLKPGTLSAIIRQSGLPRALFEY